MKVLVLTLALVALSNSKPQSQRCGGFINCIVSGLGGGSGSYGSGGGGFNDRYSVVGGSGGFNNGYGNSGGFNNGGFNDHHGSGGGFNNGGFNNHHSNSGGYGGGGSFNNHNSGGFNNNHHHGGNNYPDCQCDNLFNKAGQGNCNRGTYSKTKDNWCYIRTTSFNGNYIDPKYACPDSQLSTVHHGRYWSNYACTNTLNRNAGGHH